MEVNLQATVDALSREPDLLDSTVIELHSEQIANTKKILESVNDKLLFQDFDDTDVLFTLHSYLVSLHFEYSLQANNICLSIAPITTAHDISTTGRYIY